MHAISLSGSADMQTSGWCGRTGHHLGVKSVEVPKPRAFRHTIRGVLTREAAYPAYAKNKGPAGPIRHRPGPCTPFPPRPISSAPHFLRAPFPPRHCLQYFRPVKPRAHANVLHFLLGDIVCAPCCRQWRGRIAQDKTCNTGPDGRILPPRTKIGLPAMEIGLKRGDRRRFAGVQTCYSYDI